MLCSSNFLLVPCSPSSIPLSAGPLSCWGLVFITSADRDPPSPLCSLLRSTPCIPKISYKYIKYILLKMNLMWTHKICHLNKLILLSWRSLRKQQKQGHHSELPHPYLPLASLKQAIIYFLMWYGPSLYLEERASFSPKTKECQEES